MWPDMDKNLMNLLHVDKTGYLILLFTLGVILGILIGDRVWD